MKLEWTPVYPKQPTSKLVDIIVHDMLKRIIDVQCEKFLSNGLHFRKKNWKYFHHPMVQIYAKIYVFQTWFIVLIIYLTSTITVTVIAENDNWKNIRILTQQAQRKYT